MSLALAANELRSDLTIKIRNRIAEGAAVREISPMELPASFAAEIGKAAVAAAFKSEHAVVAVLENGKSMLRRIAQ